MRALKFTVNGVRCKYENSKLLLKFKDAHRMLGDRCDPYSFKFIWLASVHKPGSYISINYFWKMCLRLKEEKFFREFINSVIGVLADNIVANVSVATKGKEDSDDQEIQGY